MLIEGGKEGNVIVNPKVAAMGKKDGLMVYPPFEPIYKGHKDFHFTDIFREGWCSIFVSERVWMQIGKNRRS